MTATIIALMPIYLRSGAKSTTKRLCAFAAFGLAVAWVGPSIAHPLCDGPAKECQSLENITAKYAEAFNKKDVTSMVNLFTPDAVGVPWGPMWSGRQGAEGYYQAVFKAGAADHSGSVAEIHVTGNAAWAVGGWNETVPGANNARQKIGGNWAGIFVRDGEVWRVRMLTGNLFLPPSQ